MQNVRKTVARWIATATGVQQQPPRSVKPAALRTLDEAELQAVKGGSGNSTSSPTKTW
jgi:hypothetical protein